MINILKNVSWSLFCRKADALIRFFFLPLHEKRTTHKNEDIQK